MVLTEPDCECDLPGELQHDDPDFNSPRFRFVILAIGFLLPLCWVLRNSIVPLTRRVLLWLIPPLIIAGRWVKELQAFSLAYSDGYLAIALVAAPAIILIAFMKPMKIIFDSDSLPEK